MNTDNDWTRCPIVPMVDTPTTGRVTLGGCGWSREVMWRVHPLAWTFEVARWFLPISGLVVLLYIIPTPDAEWVGETAILVAYGLVTSLFGTANLVVWLICDRPIRAARTFNIAMDRAIRLRDQWVVEADQIRATEREAAAYRQILEETWR